MSALIVAWGIDDHSLLTSGHKSSFEGGWTRLHTNMWSSLQKQKRDLLRNTIIMTLHCQQFVTIHLPNAVVVAHWKSSPISSKMCSIVGKFMVTGQRNTRDPNYGTQDLWLAVSHVRFFVILLVNDIDHQAMAVSPPAVSTYRMIVKVVPNSGQLWPVVKWSPVPKLRLDLPLYKYAIDIVETEVELAILLQFILSVALVRHHFKWNRQIYWANDKNRNQCNERLINRCYINAVAIGG